MDVLEMMFIKRERKGWIIIEKVIKAKFLFDLSIDVNHV
jgi:hypothetical protein